METCEKCHQNFTKFKAPVRLLPCRHIVHNGCFVAYQKKCQDSPTCSLADKKCEFCPVCLDQILNPMEEKLIFRKFPTVHDFISKFEKYYKEGKVDPAKLFVAAATLQHELPMVEPLISHIFFKQYVHPKDPVFKKVLDNPGQSKFILKIDQALILAQDDINGRATHIPQTGFRMTRTL